jgi:glycerol-3-phosphate dehydrogenase (NAD(P)+)
LQSGQVCGLIRSMFKKAAIIGDGAMASFCAMMLVEKGMDVSMWGYDGAQLAAIERAGENVKFLPGYKLPKALRFEARDGEIFKGVDVIVSAVPCQFMRGVWKRLLPHVPAGIPVVSVTKGIENGTLMCPSQVLQDVCGGAMKCVALSGPTIADELMRRLPAVACAAGKDAALTEEVQRTFSTSWFRVYVNSDITGVELAGAMKNVIAIAAGIIDGMGAGDNAKAALLSRGLVEITRLGMAMGAKGETFAGLTGLGDLVTTCISPKGRNRSLGERIGRGASAKEALAATDSVVEGVATCRSVVALAARLGVEMPITQAVYHVIFENKPVAAAIRELMTRDLKSE